MLRNSNVILLIFFYIFLKASILAYIKIICLKFQDLNYLTVM